MTTITGNIVKSSINGFKNHIVKCANNDTYAAKALLLTTVGLNLYSNVINYYQLTKNNDIEEEEKEFLKSFRIVNGFISVIAQTAAGLAIISDKAQRVIIKGISKFYKGFDQNLDRRGRRNLLKLSSLIGAIVLTKRILTPLVVTPIASWVDNKREKYREEKKLKFPEQENLNPVKNTDENIFKKDFEKYKSESKKFVLDYKSKKSFDYFKNTGENIFNTN